MVTSGATFHNPTNSSFTPQIQPTQNYPTSNLRPPHAHPQPSHAYRAPPQPTRTTPSSDHSSQHRCNNLAAVDLFLENFTKLKVTGRLVNRQQQILSFKLQNCLEICNSSDPLYGFDVQV
nr:hypothetical protein CFP56_18401 [Quercus suber]